MIELHYYFLQQSNNTKWDLKPASDNVIVSSKGGSVVHMATYDLKALTSWPINIRAVYKKKLSYGIIPQPILHATRYVGGKRCYSLTRRQITITKFDLILGHGQAKGKLVTRIHNNYFSSDIDIVFLELIPWFCRVYLHTLTFTNSKNKPVGIGNGKI